MQGVSEEWLDFLRNQFPAGSQIQTWELDDPRNTLGETGTSEYINDSGRFHVWQNDGDECILTLGEEVFSVHPLESIQLELHMLPAASFHTRNEWGGRDETSEEWDGRTFLGYKDRILGFIVRDQVLEEAEWGLMFQCDKEFLDVKMYSVVFTAEAGDSRLWDVAECQVVGQLSPEELTGLKDYLAGQAVDGIGEDLEQQAIRIDGGELRVHMWQPKGWSIRTEVEQSELTQAQSMTMEDMSRG